MGVRVKRENRVGDIEEQGTRGFWKLLPNMSIACMPSHGLQDRGREGHGAWGFWGRCQTGTWPQQRGGEPLGGLGVATQMDQGTGGQGAPVGRQ